MNLENASSLQEITKKLTIPLSVSELYGKLTPNFDKMMEAYKNISSFPSNFDELNNAATSSAAMLAILESPGISQIKALAASMQLENQTLEAYKNIFESAEMSALLNFQKQSVAALDVSKAFQFPRIQKLTESLSFQSLFDDQYHKIFSDVAAASSISNLSEAFKYTHLLNDDFLKSQDVIQSLLDEVNLSEIKFANFSDYASLDNEIQVELAEAKDFELLSPQAKRYIFVVLIILASLFKDLSIGLFSSHVYENYIKANEELEKMTSKSELKCLLKGGFPDVDTQALKDCRVISGDKVNLREEPSMKSMVILELPAYKMVRVLDKSHRSWLEVEVQIEDEVLQGWVARRYTEYFR